MRKREAAKLLKRSRQIMNKASYERLTSMDTYLDEARQLRNLGMANAGRFGSACPSCWREIVPLGKPLPEQCQCGNVAPPEETLEALGFAGSNYVMRERLPL